MKNIMVVEDDANIRELLVYALNNNGFMAKGYPGADTFYANLDKVKPSLVILDLMLEGYSGYDILQELRKNPDYEELPIILLTAKDDEYDKVKGLDMGADDYVTKPFGVLELIARIKALLRRSPSKSESSDVLEIDDIYINHKKREVFVGDKKIDLTYKEFELLYFFFVNKDIVISRDKLMEEIWGFEYFGESRTIDVHIRSLRQKLGEKGLIIKTVRNVGYKLGV